MIRATRWLEQSSRWRLWKLSWGIELADLWLPKSMMSLCCEHLPQHLLRCARGSHRSAQLTLCHSLGKYRSKKRIWRLFLETSHQASWHISGQFLAALASDSCVPLSHLPLTFDSIRFYRLHGGMLTEEVLTTEQTLLSLDFSSICGWLTLGCRWWSLRRAQTPRRTCTTVHLTPVQDHASSEFKVLASL